MRPLGPALVGACVALLVGAPAALAQPPVALDGTVPELELVGPVSPLPAKARTNLFLEVFNLGPGDARDVSATIRPAAGGVLVVVGQLERDLERINASESALLVIRLATPDTAGGASLTVTLRFTTDDGRRVAQERTVNFQIAPPASDPLEVDLLPSELVAGRPANLTFAIRNPSSRTVDELDVFVESRSGERLLDTRIDLGAGRESGQLLRGATIPPRTLLRADLPVLASLDAPDLLPLVVRAQYQIDGFRREQAFEFATRVLGAVELRVLDTHLVATEGGYEVAGTLVNTGSRTAWNPLVGVDEESGVLAERPVLVDDLEPNRATDFRLPVRLAEGVREARPLLVVEWNDEFGRLHESEVEAGTISAPPAPLSWWGRLLQFVARPWGLALVLVVLAAAVVGGIAEVVHLRRERAREAAEEEVDRGSRERPPKRKGKGRGKPG